jgi:hypothetical protein
MSEQKDPFDELEELDVIESHELSVGNTFHAFRFRAVATELEDLDRETKSIVVNTAKSLGLTPEKFLSLAKKEAVEGDALGNFARGVAAAMALAKKQK